MKYFVMVEVDSTDLFRILFCCKVHIFVPPTECR